MEWKYNDLIKWIENGCDKLESFNVTKLYINNKKLIMIPPEIGNLINLQHLDCSHNKLTTLPKEISNLTNLQTLICYNNCLDLNLSCFNLLAVAVAAAASCFA